MPHEKYPQHLYKAGGGSTIVHDDAGKAAALEAGFSAPHHTDDGVHVLHPTDETPAADGPAPETAEAASKKRGPKPKPVPTTASA